ncbi:MAG: SPFH domain-containing protein, partial [Alkalispirochaeta sp.]
VQSVDEASDPWGIKVTRYEIKDITPSDTVMASMEQQVRAEREKRAEILSSEGVREARINSSKGDRQQSINLSQGERQRRINEAQGRARATEIIAEATAGGVAEVDAAIRMPKGRTAVALRIGEQFISGLGEIIRGSNTSVLPADLAQLRSIVESLHGTGLAGSGPGGGSPAFGTGGTGGTGGTSGAGDTGSSGNSGGSRRDSGGAS